jgi:hypothetical protein
MMITFLGGVLLGLGVWMQLLTTDLSGHPLFEYMQSWSWWQLAGLPLVAGIGFLISGAYWLRNHPAHDRVSLVFFACCLGAAIVLLFVEPLSGLLSTPVCSVVLLCFVIKHRKVTLVAGA